MSLKRSYLLAGLLIAGLGLKAYAQGPGDLFTIKFPREIIVGDKILPAGQWEIGWDGTGNSPMLTVSRDKAVHTRVRARAIPSDRYRDRTTTEGVIEKMGLEYYLISIWIKGQDDGFRIDVPSSATTLPHGEVRRIPATFVSAPRLAQGAEIEGQERSHVTAQPGNVEDQSPTGLVMALSYFPSSISVVAGGKPASRPLPSDVLLEIFAPPGSLLVAAAPALSGPGGRMPDSEPALSTPATLLTATEVPAAILMARNEPPQILPAVASTDAQIQQRQGGDAFDPPEQPISDVRDPSEGGVLDSQQASNLSDFGGALPATASSWLELGLIGIALVGLSFAVRWG